MTEKIASPAFVLEQAALRKNLELLKDVQERAGVKIILALKAFAFYPAFPLIKEYLHGATASSLNEAKLIFNEMGVEAHSYNVAYLPEEFPEIIELSSHVVFNSVSQYKRFKPMIEASGKALSCGIRINPDYSTVATDLYNPAKPGTRLGEEHHKFSEGLPDGIEGLHFHTLCESSSYDLEKTLNAVEEKFGKLLPEIKWLNIGGGHHITEDSYDVEHLIEVLKAFKSKYNLEIIMEPGSAVVWNTGYLLCTVLDIHESHGIKTAILDVSFTAHMPDTLEMPYRPDVRGASSKKVKGGFPYRLGGVSCLSGDYMDEYWFEEELKPGDRLILENMITYTTVKTTMFNGVKHPDYGMIREDGIYEVMRAYTYEDYRRRNG